MNTKASKTTKTASKRPANKPAGGWPKDQARAAYLAGKTDADRVEAARKVATKYEVENHRIERWLKNDFPAALKDATKVAKVAPAKKGGDNVVPMVKRAAKKGATKTAA